MSPELIVNLEKAAWDGCLL